MTRAKAQNTFEERLYKYRESTSSNNRRSSKNATKQRSVFKVSEPIGKVVDNCSLKTKKKENLTPTRVTRSKDNKANARKSVTPDSRIIKKSSPSIKSPKTKSHFRENKGVLRDISGALNNHGNRFAGNFVFESPSLKKV